MRVRAERGAIGGLLLFVVVLALTAVVATVSITRPEAGGESLRLGREEARPDDATSAAIESLRAYWSAELPATYQKTFLDLAGGYQPKTPESPPFSCGGQRLTYDDLRGNAFYCGGPDDDYIAWDAALLFPRLTERYGGIAPAIVLAHELGHAIQARVQVRTASVVQELQADCFAGSWTKYAETSDEDPVVLADGALDSAVATVLTLRDQPGTPATAPQAHGLGFDRVNAFQTGYEHGAERCAEFPTEGVVTTELPFRTEAEAATGGNLPLNQAVPLLTESLDQFWSAALPRIADGVRFDTPTLNPVRTTELPDCPSDPDPDDDGVAEYCASTDSVDLLARDAATLHAQIGDLGSGTALSEAWGGAAQAQAELPVTGREAGLQRDCFTGAWLASLAADGLANSLLSPGDLDEALTTIVVSTFRDDGRRRDRGGAFERTRSLRTGVFEGLDACL